MPGVQLSDDNVCQPKRRRTDNVCQPKTQEQRYLEQLQATFKGLGVTLVSLLNQQPLKPEREMALKHIREAVFTLPRAIAVKYELEPWPAPMPPKYSYMVYTENADDERYPVDDLMEIYLDHYDWIFRRSIGA